MTHRYAPSPIAYRRGQQRLRGFTLLELMVVLAILGALLALAAPRYIDVLDRGKRKAQAANLQTLRATLDAFHDDLGRWPESLDELVQRRYLRAVPIDPVTDAVDWVVIAPPSGQVGRVWDVRSATAAVAGSVETAGSKPDPTAAP